MRIQRTLRLMSVLLGLAGCKNLNVPDYNAASLTSLQETPTRSSVATWAQGLLAQLRDNTFSMALLMGVYGRESYILDVSNPYLTSFFYVNLDQDAAGGVWGTSYATLRHANVLLHSTDAVPGVSEAEKEGLRGFAKTSQAIDLLNLIVVLDSSGAAIDVDVDPTAELAPIVPKAQVYARIYQLLDAAAGHLDKAGGRFMFQMSEGFAPFNSPAAFKRLNRGIRARLDAYQKKYSDALTDLAASFLDTSQPLTFGAYHTFSNNSGDQPNPLYDPQPRQFFPVPLNLKEAAPRPDGSLDLRAQQKLAPITPTTVIGIDVDSRFLLYPSPNSPMPLIRNEELILLRAEARYFTGDKTGALSDINLIRVSSGGLAERGAFTSDDDFVTELLFNRRYSLMWEGGFRWIDARRFGRLTQLPRLQPNYKFFAWFPIPTNECLARTPAPPGCSLPPGL